MQPMIDLIDGGWLSAERQGPQWVENGHHARIVVGPAIETGGRGQNANTELFGPWLHRNARPTDRHWIL